MTQDYYGTKLVTAWPQEKTITHPEGAGEVREGYAVKYEDGFISWSPKDVFEKHYRPLNELSFGHALEALKAGRKVARYGWNGKGMWLKKVPVTYYGVNSEIDEQGGADTRVEWIGMKTADNKFVPWLASQTDVLANDWCVLPSVSETEPEPTPELVAA